MNAAYHERTDLGRRLCWCVSSATHRRAFTYIELVTVVIIIAILGAIVAPRFVASLSFHRVEAAARRIKTDLELARQHARTTGASQTVKFLPETDSYILIGMDHLDHPDQTYSVDISAVPYEATIVSAVFGAAAVLIFDGYGVPSTAGDVVVQAGASKRTISVDPVTGKVTIQ